MTPAQRGLSEMVLVVSRVTALAFIGLLACTGKEGPRSAIFKSQGFAAPVGIDPGEGDRPGLLEHARRNAHDRGLVPTIYTTAYRFADKRLVSYLVSNGYATVECVPISNRYEAREECFLMHTPKVKMLDSAAHRVLVSIDYENSYEAAPFGMPMKFHAVTFTYRVASDLPGIPSLPHQYKGKAKAVLNPDVGLWEIAEIELDDRAETEIRELLLAESPPFERRTRDAAPIRMPQSDSIALDRRPNTTQAADADSDMNRAIAAMQSGRREAAREAFSQIARENLELATPHIFLSRLAPEEGDLETARSDLETAIRLEPNSAIALREMGLILFSAGNYELSRSFFGRALNANSKDRASMGYLGCALARLNRFDEAQRFIARAGSGAWSSCLHSPGM